MNEQAVIGIPFTHDKETVVLYLQFDYDRNYPATLAEGLEWASYSDARSASARLLQFLLEQFDARVSPALPETNHTIHIVDFTKQEVQLFDDEDNHNLLVSFSFDKFLERYNF